MSKLKKIVFILFANYSLCLNVSKYVDLKDKSVEKLTEEIKKHELYCFLMNCKGKKSEEDYNNFFKCIFCHALLLEVLFEYEKQSNFNQDEIMSMLSLQKLVKGLPSKEINNMHRVIFNLNKERMNELNENKLLFKNNSLCNNDENQLYIKAIIELQKRIENKIKLNDLKVNYNNIEKWFSLLFKKSKN